MKNDEQKVICEATKKVCMSFREAGRTLNRLRKHHRTWSKKNEIPRRKYYCEYCGFYHLTHMRAYEDGRDAKLNEKRFYSLAVIKRQSVVSA